MRKKLSLKRERALTSETTRLWLIGMSGSLRSSSYSNAVLETLREKFAGRADLKIYDLSPIPLYNQDLEGEKRPEPVKALLAAIAESDGVILCAPEFNHSVPGVLKKRARLGLAPCLYLGHGVQAGCDYGDLARSAGRCTLSRTYARRAGFDACSSRLGTRGDDYLDRR